jgi:galactose mutarotase-like enzyme
MDIKIENDVLEAVISSSGAELISLKTRKDGAERIWQADPEIWKRHAPILFPYTGKLREGHFFYNGEEYKGRPARVCARC